MNWKVFYCVSFSLFLFGCTTSIPSTPAEITTTADVTIRVPEPYRIEITGRNYRWKVRYPGADGELNTSDDVLSDRDVHVPLNTEVILQLKSEDFVYLLSLPEFKLKEIAVPSLDFQLTIHPMTIGQYALDTDQLCGDEHPEMKGLLFVETRMQFETWLREKTATRTAHLSGQFDGHQ